MMVILASPIRTMVSWDGPRLPIVKVSQISTSLVRMSAGTGDEFDFSEFDKVIEPKQIKAMFKVFSNIYKASGSRRLTILTARAAYRPVRQFLKDVGYTDVFVVALGDSNPQKKADWIEGQIKKGYNDILFLDDSPKNVRVVKQLKRKYPKIKMDARVVDYG